MLPVDGGRAHSTRATGSAVECAFRFCGFECAPGNVELDVTRSLVRHTPVHSFTRSACSRSLEDTQRCFCRRTTPARMPINYAAEAPAQSTFAYNIFINHSAHRDTRKHRSHTNSGRHSIAVISTTTVRRARTSLSSRL